MVRNHDGVSCYFAGSHQCPAVCPVACTLQCLEKHLTSGFFPPGWHITPGSWDGRGLPYSERSLGTFFPLWDSILSCIFTILCSRAAQLDELMLDWKSPGHTNSHTRPKVPVTLYPRCSSGPHGPQKEPRESSCWYLHRAFSTLCLPGLEAVTSHLIIIPSRLLLLDHLQLLRECRRCCSSLYSRAHAGTATRMCEHKPLVGSQAAGARAPPSLGTNQVTSLLFTTISFNSLPPNVRFIKAGEETSKPSLPEDYST